MGGPDESVDDTLDGSPEDIQLVDELVRAARGLKTGSLDDRGFEERVRDLWGEWLDRLPAEGEDA